MKTNIREVYTINGIVYTCSGEHHPSKTTVLNCTMTQTNYGSIIISRPTSPNNIEIYPSQISHIIF